MARKGILLILDGYGEGEKGEFNAVENANTPFIKKIKNEYPHCLVYTHGKYVGLTKNSMGGSEVGHMTIGAGRIKKSMTVKIDDDIESGAFFDKEILKENFKNLKENNGALHIAGLWSDKQIHSNLHHAFALMKMAKMYGIDRVLIHAFTDGRDCAQKSCMQYFDMFKSESEKLNIGEIATIGGRFYAMDRESNLERTSKAIDQMLNKNYRYSSVKECVEDNYNHNITDEFFVPERVKTKKPYSCDKNDLLIYFNTRADRMKQPVKMSCEKLPCKILSMCEFIEDDRVQHIYDEDIITNTLSEYLSNLNLRQVKISETTKYAHVTYFFNGGEEKQFKNEDRIHIPTIKTNDYAETPQMRAREIADAVLKSIDNNYDAIIVNFSNPDMVGHTGNYEATVKALEFLDNCIKDVVEKAMKENYFILMTADHGNAETMRDENGNPHTSHTLNPVRCVIIDKKHTNIVMHDGGLRDIAPTFVSLMKLPQNPSFEGSPLYN